MFPKRVSKLSENKRTEYQIIHDRKVISEMLLEGVYSQQDIADCINENYKNKSIDITLSRRMISYDIQKIIKIWKEETLTNVGDLKALQEKRILKIKKESDLAWHRSYGEHIKKRTKGGYNAHGRFEEELEETEDIAGDPRFLTVSLNCVIQINKMNGIDVEEKNKDSDVDDSSINSLTKSLDKSHKKLEAM